MTHIKVCDNKGKNARLSFVIKVGDVTAPLTHWMGKQVKRIHSYKYRDQVMQRYTEQVNISQYYSASTDIASTIIDHYLPLLTSNQTTLLIAQYISYLQVRPVVSIEKKTLERCWRTKLTDENIFRLI